MNALIWTAFLLQVYKPYLLWTMLLYCRFYCACGFCLDWLWFCFMPVIRTVFSREPNGVSDRFRVSDDVLSWGMGSAKA